MRIKHTLPFPRHEMPELFKRITLKIKEGAGNAGCPMDPRPPVQQKAQASATTGSPATTGIPCAMVLTGSFVLFLVTGLFCHHHS
jgi:hypothetical protein